MPLFLTTGLFYLFNLVHPFHVTVLEVNYDEQEKAIQMTTRIFLDDLEVALRPLMGNTFDIMDYEGTEELNQTLNNYLNKSLGLKIKGDKKLQLQYLGHEFDKDVLWCYLEVVKIKPFDRLVIENSILTEAFEDQENLIHVRKSGKVKSARLSSSKTTTEFTWEAKKRK